MEVTLGGDRLGSGNKQTVKMHDYEMSSFNLEQDWKSSMAPGVLYPFLKLIGTNHGTFDIDLDSFIRTLPTRGPLFGSYKLQVDLFEVPLRLYQAILHNNAQKIGMKMNQVYLPKLEISLDDNQNQPIVNGSNLYNRQISDSSLLKYMGLSGIGTNVKYKDIDTYKRIHRKINAIPVLAYYDIFKNYYANKQEENAYVIVPGTVSGTPQTFINGTTIYGGGQEIMEYDNENVRGWNVILKEYDGRGDYNYEFTSAEWNINNLNINYGSVYVYFEGIENPENEILSDFLENNTEYSVENNKLKITSIYWQNLETLYGETISRIEFHFTEVDNNLVSDIQLRPFNLQNIDDMRMAILSKNNFGQEFVLGLYGDWTNLSGTDGTGLPYSALFREKEVEGEKKITYNAFELNGLCVKTYQSDLFNNWLDSEWIEGEEGIAALTAIATQDGKFTIDSFIFAEKLYDIYNRIATGGGSYEDWQDAVYGEGAVRKAETPMYIGGMAAEVMFEEVISNSETLINGDFQALGSLGGKGTQVNKRGGNNIHVKLREPGYIIGIASITPRICYSQGNDWDLTDLDTMDDLHKPGLDGIGFQDLIVERMAWWNTRVDPEERNPMLRQSAGKQTAWINYQTAVDKCYGDFAKQNGYAFMVLNRNYEMDEETMYGVKDITTYIDPKKYNYAFAYDELAAQNFWAQIHSTVIARRKMGAQQIPNL